MPVTSCQQNERPGFRWGQQGKCYTYPVGSKSGSIRAKSLALRQGKAIQIQAVNGAQSAFEIDFRGRFVALGNKIRKLEDKITGALKEYMGELGSVVVSEEVATLDEEVLLREIKKAYDEMINAFDRWAKKEVPLRYKRSIRQIQRRIEANKGILETARKGITELVDSRATGQISAALWSDATETFAMGARAGQRNIARFTRVTKQALLNESIIDADIAKAIVKGNLNKAITTISQRLSLELESVVGEKRYVQAGSRKMRPRAYAETVARTKFHETHTAAALAEARNYDTDLVQVSAHNTTTEICQQFEGKVYSLSGDDKRFPPLRDSPPFHPNCLHLLFPTFISGMETQGTLEEFSEFSKGKTNKPPVPSSFVPVDDRVSV